LKAGWCEEEEEEEEDCKLNPQKTQEKTTTKYL
jgi:hypothetical protein